MLNLLASLAFISYELKKPGFSIQAFDISAIFAILIIAAVVIINKCAVRRFSSPHRHYSSFSLHCQLLEGTLTGALLLAALVTVGSWSLLVLVPLAAAYGLLLVAIT